MSDTSKTLAVKLTANAEKIVKKGHPWVFSDSIKKISNDAETGDICILFDNKNNSLYALGLFDKNSPIRIKIISQEKTSIDNNFFFRKIKEAFNKRTKLIARNTNAYRLIYGENDFLPGIIADVYDKIIVLKIYSSAWIPFIEIIKDELAKILNPQAIIQRLSRNVIKENPNNLKDGEIVFGSMNGEEVVFLENGVKFFANVIKGHKTGFFLDHRQNRIKIENMSKAKTVLDVFAYAGGFSVHALAGGANNVTSVDISAQALEIAERNAELNGFKNKLQYITGDAFKELQTLINKGKKFDIVIIDPPSFAKSKKEVNTALKKYQELAILGYNLTKVGGDLILASCSSRVSLSEFENCHSNAFRGKKIKKVEITTHDIDHKAIIEESEYLKTIYYKLMN